MRKALRDASWSYQVAATLFWILFVGWRVGTAGMGPWALSAGASMDSLSTPRLLLILPERDASVRLLRIVTEQGEGASKRRQALSRQLDDISDLIMLPTDQLGRLEVKAVVLDQSGCIVYGGSVEAMLEPRAPLLSLTLRKLDVPLCG